MGFIVFLLYHFGYSLIYLDLQRYGLWYLPLSALLMILFHDGYFYWTHRLLHQPGWYQKVHQVHHLSSNPSPFTALAFHPVESLIQAAVLPLIILLIPAHPFAIFFFLTYMVYKNVRGMRDMNLQPHLSGKKNGTGCTVIRSITTCIIYRAKEITPLFYHLGQTTKNIYTGRMILKSCY
jgi:sterol desaturase/sphingolipid hydroxylase (fatty acid hydroxylase superfamily)